jgi:hypothetical protein
MQFKHTPLPWRRLDGKVVNSDGTIVIARVMTRNAADGPKSVTEAAANANLISWAPDLAQHLHSIVEAIHQSGPVLAAAVSKANELLKKLEE